MIDADMLAGCASVFDLGASRLPSPAQIALRRAVRRRHVAVVDAHRAECRLWAVSAVIQAARELFGNVPAGAPEPSAWSLQNPVLYTLAWVVLIIAVFAPLAVRRYQNAR